MRVYGSHLLKIWEAKLTGEEIEELEEWLSIFSFYIPVLCLLLPAFLLEHAKPYRPVRRLLLFKIPTFNIRIIV